MSSSSIPIQSAFTMTCMSYSYRINLFSASSEELDALAAACTPEGGIGVVADESSGKARKLDVSRFASMFELRNSDIPQVIEDSLVDGKQGNQSCRFKLSGLNLYSEQSWASWLLVDRRVVIV